MFNVNEQDNLIQFTISSDMRLIDRLILNTKEYLEQFNISNFSEFRVVLRELLINAVEHGNKKTNIHKSIICNIEHLDSLRFKITVEDQGQGFDYKNISTNMPDPGQIRTRGYALITSYSDKVEFNDTGNQVIVYISVSQETCFNLTQKRGWQNIMPTGDITAGIADNFRRLLVKLADRGHMKYCFDLKHVKDIDSIGLSILIIFAKMLDKKDAEKQLVIINAVKPMIELFNMTRLDKIYGIKANHDS